MVLEVTVEGRRGSEKPATIGATRTTSDAPGAGTRVLATTCGGVLSTTMVTAFEVTVLPLLVSCAVTEYVPSVTPVVFHLNDAWGGVTVPTVAAVAPVAMMEMGALVGLSVETTIETGP